MKHKVESQHIIKINKRSIYLDIDKNYQTDKEKG